MTGSILPRNEVIRRLRERSQPISLFGESDEDSFQRLKQLEISDPDQSTGVINDFKLAMDKVNHDISNSCQGSSSSNKGTDVSANEVKGTIKEMQELIHELHPTNNFTDERVISNDCDIMLKYPRFILDSYFSVFDIAFDFAIEDGPSFKHLRGMILSCGAYFDIGFVFCYTSHVKFELMEPVQGCYNVD